MDREIPKEVRDKERRNRIIKYAVAVGAVVVVIAVVMSLMRSSVSKKDIVLATVDRGTIESSVSASGKSGSAFEEVINSPISTRIVEVYPQGGDSVDVGTPLLRLDLQSTETELNKLLDQSQMKQYEIEQMKPQQQHPPERPCHECKGKGHGSKPHGGGVAQRALPRQPRIGYRRQGASGRTGLQHRKLELEQLRQQLETSVRCVMPTCV